jgi:hypothetical protein
MKIELKLQGKSIKSDAGSGAIAELKKSLFPMIQDERAMQSAIRKVGRNQIKNIRERTARGYGANGRRFKGLAKSTKETRVPRPRKGWKKLPSSTRGSKGPPLNGLKKILSKLFISSSSSAGGRRVSLIIGIKDETVRSSGRNVSARLIAAVLNNGASMGPRTRAKGYRIPLNNRKKENDKGIFTRSVRATRIPARPFMGWTVGEIKQAASIFRSEMLKGGF